MRVRGAYDTVTVINSVLGPATRADSPPTTKSRFVLVRRLRLGRFAARFGGAVHPAEQERPGQRGARGRQHRGFRGQGRGPLHLRRPELDLRHSAVRRERPRVGPARPVEHAAHRRPAARRGQPVRRPGRRHARRGVGARGHLDEDEQLRHPGQHVLEPRGLGLAAPRRQRPDRAQQLPLEPQGRRHGSSHTSTRCAGGGRLYGKGHRFASNTVWVMDGKPTQKHERPFLADSGDVEPGTTSNGHAYVQDLVCEDNLFYRCGNGGGPVFDGENYSVRATGTVREQPRRGLPLPGPNGVTVIGSGSSSLQVSGNQIHATAAAAGVTLDAAGWPTHPEKGAKAPFLIPTWWARAAHGGRRAGPDRPGGQGGDVDGHAGAGGLDDRVDHPQRLRSCPEHRTPCSRGCIGPVSAGSTAGEAHQAYRPATAGVRLRTSAGGTGSATSLPMMSSRCSASSTRAVCRAPPPRSRPEDRVAERRRR